MSALMTSAEPPAAEDAWMLGPWADSITHQTPCCSWIICLHPSRCLWGSFSVCPLPFCLPLHHVDYSCYCWNHVSTRTLCLYSALSLFDHFQPLPLLPVCGSCVSAAAADVYSQCDTSPTLHTHRGVCSTQVLLASARKWLGWGSADEHVCGLSWKFETFMFGFKLVKQVENELNITFKLWLRFS